jgi:hypothetical protein
MDAGTIAKRFRRCQGEQPHPARPLDRSPDGLTRHPPKNELLPTHEPAVRAGRIELARVDDRGSQQRRLLGRHHGG